MDSREFCSIRNVLSKLQAKPDKLHPRLGSSVPLSDNNRRGLKGKASLSSARHRTLTIGRKKRHICTRDCVYVHRLCYNVFVCGASPHTSSGTNLEQSVHVDCHPRTLRETQDHATSSWSTLSDIFGPTDRPSCVFVTRGSLRISGPGNWYHTRTRNDE